MDLSAKELASIKISVSEPFAEFLEATPEEVNFDLSLLDTVRFAGHACFSVVGAFLRVKTAVEELYPETHRCVRGQVEVFIKGKPDQGATGPIANVIGFITGAWAESGFGGLNGRFSRRNLLHYGADVPDGVIRFRRMDNGKTVDVEYTPSSLHAETIAGEPFQAKWRRQIRLILEAPDKVISTRSI